MVGSAALFGFVLIYFHEIRHIPLDRAGFAVAAGAACSSANPEPSHVLRAMGVGPDLARGALAGCNSYLVKPVSLQSLRETVARQLHRSARRLTL